MIILTEIYRLHEYAGIDKNDFSLREVVVNPSHIFMIREDEKMSGRLSAGQLPDGLDERQRFTKIYFNTLNHGTLTIVGDPMVVRDKLGG